MGAVSRWTDQAYVRVYTAPSADYAALGCEARGLLFDIFRLLDRNGRFKLGRDGTRAVWLVLDPGREVAWETFAARLQRILDRGCLVVEGDILSCPNFVEAQNWTRSDKLRAKEYRDRKRLQSPNGTARRASRGVTKRNVAPRHDTPVHDAHESSPPGREGGREGDLLDLDPDLSKRDPRAAEPPAAALQDLWNAIARPVGLPAWSEMPPKRRRQCAVRLRERPLEAWKAVIERIAASAFCRGDNDRGWRATPDWLIANAENASKVLEGKYDRIGAGKASSSPAEAPAKRPPYHRPAPAPAPPLSREESAEAAAAWAEARRTSLAIPDEPEPVAASGGKRP